MIGQNIENLKDAYRSNPQKLKERYGQTRQLEDLLALQAMKSDTDAVKRSQALSADENAGTVAEKLEAEVFAGYKQKQVDKVADVRGILAHKKRTQDKNMRKIADAASKPKGIATLSGSAEQKGLGSIGKTPNAQMPVGAQGGIVGFFSGKGVEGSGRYPQLGGTQLSTEDLAAIREAFPAEYQKYIRLIKQNPDGIPMYQLDLRTQNKISEALGERRVLTDNDRARLASGLTDQSGMDSQGGSGFDMAPIVATERATDPTLPTLEIPKVGEETADATQAGAVIFPPKPAPVSALANLNSDVKFVGPEIASTAEVDAATEAALLAAGKNASPLTAVKVDPTLVDRAALGPVDEGSYLTETNEQLLEGITQQDVNTINQHQDPFAVGLDARDEAAALADRKGVAAVYEQQLADQKALDARTLSPEALETYRRRAAFSGGASKGSGTRALNAATLKTNQLENEGLSGLRAIQDTGITTDQGIVTNALTEQGRARGDSTVLQEGALGRVGERIANQANMSKTIYENTTLANIADAKIINTGKNRNANEADAIARHNSSLKDSGFDRLANARREILRSKVSQLASTRDRFDATARAKLDVEIANARTAIEKAKGSDRFKEEMRKIDRLTAAQAEQLYISHKLTLQQERNAYIQTDVLNRNILLKKMEKAKNTPREKDVEQEWIAYVTSVEKDMAFIFSLSYALLDELELKADAARAAAGQTQWRPTVGVGSGATVTEVEQ